MIMSRIHTYDNLSDSNLLLIEIVKQIDIQLSKHIKDSKGWYWMNASINNTGITITIGYENGKATFSLSILNTDVYCDDEYINNINEPNFLSNVDKIIESRKLYERFTISIDEK